MVAISTISKIYCVHGSHLVASFSHHNYTCNSNVFCICPMLIRWQWFVINTWFTYLRLAGRPLLCCRASSVRVQGFQNVISIFINQNNRLRFVIYEVIGTTIIYEYITLCDGRCLYLQVSGFNMNLKFVYTHYIRPHTKSKNRITS